jgi:uroporphyrinogen decarboxylase
MNSMTHQERVWAAINHQQTDIVPYHIFYTMPAREKLQAYFGADSLEDKLGNHLAKLRIRIPDVEVKPGCWRDEYGVVWNRTIDKDVGVVEDYRIKTRKLIDLNLPAPDDPRRLAMLEKFVTQNPQRFKLVSLSNALFERAWSLRGMEDLMVDMMEAPDFVDDLFDYITDYHLQEIDVALRYGIDGISISDDWGTQTGLMFSPRLWRKFIKPRIAKLFDRIKAAEKAKFAHSCGKIQTIFDDLIEIGLDVFNPFQPEVMDVYAIKEKYGEKLAFFGGVGVQSILPYGTPEEVQAEIQQLIEKVGQGGGFIIGPSHALPGDVPLENMLAMVEAFHHQ